MVSLRNLSPAKKLDGEKLFLQINFKLNKNSKGEIISSEGSFVDISERIRNEHKLLESKKGYRLFLQNFQGIAYESQYLSFTPNFFYGTVEEITGYSSQDFIQGNIAWDKLIHPENLPRFIQKGKTLESNLNQARILNIAYLKGMVR